MFMSRWLQERQGFSFWVASLWNLDSLEQTASPCFQYVIKRNLDKQRDVLLNVTG